MWNAPAGTCSWPWVDPIWALAKGTHALEGQWAGPRANNTGLEASGELKDLDQDRRRPGEHRTQSADMETGESGVPVEPTLIMIRPGEWRYSGQHGLSSMSSL